MAKNKTIVLIAVGSLVAATVCAALVALALRLAVFEPFRIPSGSMYPGLPPGSHVWVHKLDKEPAYGAIMVFRYPENPEQDFLKRVVGLPGDVIETHGAVVTINGWEIPHCEVGKTSYVEADSMTPTHSGMLDVEWLGDETYLVFHDDHSLAMSSPTFTVKSGEYYVLGDNRDNSHDSRMWFGGLGGGVPEENTLGRVRSGKIELPRGAESLRSAFDACLAKKPAKTTPR
ncbi:MAG TPA: signal peptidase I [Polyangiaceae bacterium]|jgi:signal peptidase I